MTSPPDPESKLRSEINGACGTLWLDRPEAMNALTLPMVKALATTLTGFETDPAVRTILIRSTRPGVFCAGGDVRAIRAARLAGRDAEADQFFAEEFALNGRIARCAKPFVAFMDGICMGGGLGLSAHGAHRVVSEHTMLAMPEAAIGYAPDVGATYFLNRLRGRVGLYMALTGARLDAADALFCGLATAHVPQDRLDGLAAALAQGEGEVGTIVASFTQPPGRASQLAANFEAIERCFAGPTIAAITEALAAEKTDFAATALVAMAAGAPMSLDITLAQIRRAETWELQTCLDAEYDLACAMTRQPDFAEGVRAMLVDKDRKPRWSRTVEKAAPGA